MIAHDDPFIGEFRAPNAAFNHVIRLDAIIHFDFEVDFYAIAAQVILEGQSALPVFRSDGAIHVFEQWLGIVPGERQSHDLRRGDCFFNGNAFRAGNRSPAGRLWIAGDHEVIRDRAALDVIFGTPRAVGIDFAFLVSVFLRIAVDEHRGRALALGGERFESAIAVGIRIADEDDLAFDADAVLAQQLVIFRIAAVRVDDGRSDVSGDRHAQPRAADRGILRVIVAGKRRFAENGLIVRGSDHLQRCALGIGAVDVVAMDDDVFEALLLPFVGDVVGEFVVALRSGDVRLLR